MFGTKIKNNRPGPRSSGPIGGFAGTRNESISEWASRVLAVFCSYPPGGAASASPTQLKQEVLPIFGAR
jgi:hypothetical protein